MPDEARDGRNVALNLTSVHGVLDCPKKNQAITQKVCMLSTVKGQNQHTALPAMMQKTHCLFILPQLA